jgi:hypothetical protein
MKDFGVWCRVSGGVTGPREAWLKEDGQQWTGSQEEAENKATELNSYMGRGTVFGFATFNYQARQL